MKTVKKVLINLLFILIVCTMIAPFIYMFLCSLTENYNGSITFNFSKYSLANYITIFKSLNFGLYFFNTMIVVIFTCFLNVAVGSLAGYAFAKKHFRGRDTLFSVLLLTLMVPGQVTMIPVFIMMRDFNLLNTRTALILPLVNAFSVFLMRQSMLQLPDELLDAARIDGCSELGIFLKIVLPSMKTAMLSLTIFTFISAWNDFLWPLVVTTDNNMRTLTLALSTLKGNYGTNYGLIMAGAVLSFLPPFLCYVLLQNKFEQGVTMSGIKG